MDIWEPCNYVSNLAYDRLLVEICVQQACLWILLVCDVSSPSIIFQGWSLPHKVVTKIAESFAILTFGSSFMHGRFDNIFLYSFWVKTMILSSQQHEAWNGARCPKQRSLPLCHPPGEDCHQQTWFHVTTYHIILKMGLTNQYHHKSISNQAAVGNFEYNPIIHDLSLEPRALSAEEAVDTWLDMWESDADTWSIFTSKIDAQHIIKRTLSLSTK